MGRARLQMQMLLTKSPQKKLTPKTNDQGPIYRLLENGLHSNAVSAFERTGYPRSNVQHTVDRRKPPGPAP
jgi:hypothetical protein